MADYKTKESSRLGSAYGNVVQYVPMTRQEDVKKGEAIIPAAINPWNPQNKIHKLYEQGKDLFRPLDTEARGLQEKQRMIDEYASDIKPASIYGHMSVPDVTGVVPAGDKNPEAYGSRPGEQRLDLLLRPLGPSLPEPKELQSAYQEGTKNVPEDGEAKVHEGEATVPPELNPFTKPFSSVEDEEVSVPYRRMHIPPVQSDTDAPAEYPTISPLGNAVGEPPMMLISSGAKIKPITPAPEKVELPEGPIKEDIDQAVSMGTSPYGVAKGVAPDPEAIALQEKKKEASDKGDLVGLGLANLAERHTVLPKYTGAMGPGEERPAPGETIKNLPGAEEATVAGELKTPQGWKSTMEALKNHLTAANLAGNQDEVRKTQEQIINLEREKPRSGLGKILHGLAGAGEVALGMAVPGSTAFIPGTEAHRRLEEAQISRGEQREEKEEEIKKTQAEIRAMGLPKVMPDSEGAYDRATGKVYEKWQLPYGGGTVYAPEGSSAADVLAIRQGQKPGLPTAAQLVRGKPTPETMPASQAEIANAKTEIGGLPGISEEEKGQLLNELPANPTVNDIKMVKETAKTVGAARQKKDENAASLALRELTAGLAQSREEDREQKVHSDSVQQAESSYTTLRQVEAYNDAVKDWHKATSGPKYEKDLAIIGGLVNQVNSKAATNVLGSFSDATTLGAIAGKAPGAIIGAVVGGVGSAFGGEINALIEGAKRQGLSDEGYKAMQTYVNALPGLIGYEVSVRKDPATVLRSAYTMNAIMNTIPKPSTPEKQWDEAYKTFYGPMKHLTDTRVSTLPRLGDWKPPSKEDVYGTSKETTKTAPGGLSDEQQKQLDALRKKHLGG